MTRVLTTGEIAAQLAHADVERQKSAAFYRAMLVRRYGWTRVVVGRGWRPGE